MFNQCILYNAKKLERTLSQIVEEEFKNIDMHPTYAYILRVIASADYVKTKHISCQLGLDSSTVTRMVAKLEKDGYVTKGSENSPVDISLTPKGKKLIPEIIKAWDNYHDRCDELLSAEGTKQLNDYLIDVNQKLNA